MKPDHKIDELIRPPRKIYEGYDWTRTDRLKPTGAAANDKILGERFGGASREKAVE